MKEKGKLRTLSHGTCLLCNSTAFSRSLMQEYEEEAIGRILRWGPKKISGARLFPLKFFDFLHRNPHEILKYRGILSLKTTFEGQNRAFRTYIYYLYNFRGEAGQNIGGAMAPLAPPLTTSLTYNIF